MKMNKMLAGILSASLIAGCADNKIKEPIGFLLPQPKYSPEEIKHILGHQEPCPVCRDLNSETIESKTGFYESYSVEAIIKESRWGEPIGERQRSRRLKIIDAQESRIVAELNARTAWGSEFPFEISYSNVPENHALRGYSPERLEEIYNSIMEED